MPPTKVKIYKKRVYYPEGKASRDLYVNKRYEKRISPRRIVGSDLTAHRICGKQCVALSASTNRRCKHKTCQDYRYCSIHLAYLKHLVVAKSKRLRDFQVEGLGLYAYDPMKGTLKKDAHGIPIEDNSKTVFRKGDFVGDYGGERLSKKQFNARYKDKDDQETASYAESGEKGGWILDALGAASAVTYANESLNVAKLLSTAKSRRSFEKQYESAASKDKKASCYTVDDGHKMIKMKAGRTIHQGEEILWHYGPGYWSTNGMKSMLTGKAW